MPQIDFLPFANTETANVIDQATYTSLTTRGSGFVSGVAQSAQLNKVWRQSSLMTAALATFIANTNGTDVIDDGNVATLAEKFTNSIKNSSTKLVPATKTVLGGVKVGDSLTVTADGTLDVAGSGVPTGAIIMWSGAINTIPATWALCDGQGGRPNLLDRFVVGAGSAYGVGATGGNANSVLVAHNHGIGDHTHPVNDPGHVHTPNSIVYGSGGPASSQGGNNLPYSPSTSNNKTGITIGAAQGQTSDAGVDGTNANLPPFFALAYIIKL